MSYKVIVEKEFYQISKNELNIGLLMMVKNEQLRIEFTLKSIISDTDKTKFVDGIIVYDTGSTDKTIEIIQNFCENNKINLYMIQGEFIDFSTSRNVSLEYADTKNFYYLLLLDCNDEIRGGLNLRKYAKEYSTIPNNAFLVCQQWWAGTMDKYYNVRFVKARCGWRYRGSVHEWMKDTTQEGSEPKYSILRMNDDFFLFQDRTKDDDKTVKRFNRDRELLLKDYKKNPKETRTLFYLAQTCECMGSLEEALYYSKLRAELEGFQEEKFHSFMRCGNISSKLEHAWSDIMGWYMKAFEHSNRAEPLIKIAEYYKNNKKWHIAYMFAKSACEIPYPEYCILFVDKSKYDYFRWHLLGICAYYYGDYACGKQACLKAIEAKGNVELDTKNLQFYLEKEKESKPIFKIETKQEFIERTTKELKLKNPNLPASQITKRVATLWKNRKIENK